MSSKSQFFLVSRDILFSDSSSRLNDSISRRLDELNPTQREAVEASDGPLLVLAGAGTGKTKFLTMRIAYLVSQGYCHLSQILAVTFTNKAAAEMRLRVADLLGEDMQGLYWLGTFHQTGLKILRRHHDLIGLPQQFSILDSDDQLRLIKQTLKALNIDEKRYPPRLMLWAVERFKDRGLLPEKVTRAETERLKISPQDSSLFTTVYQTYQSTLARLGAVDFGDLLLLNLELFQKYPEVLSGYTQRFRYVLVDEYQDINVAQYIWLRLLTQPHQNICCVGDEDQAIYGWRGAEVDHILRFESDFPGTQLIRFEENYRSTARILGAASHLIAHNKARLGKTLRPARDQIGEKILVRGFPNDREEARFIGHTLGDLLQSGENPEDMAVLVRAGFQTREIEERLLVMGIPYRLVGALRFYERAEIKDAVSYLRLVNHPHDNLAFERTLNTPKRGLGAATLQKLHTFARDHQISLYQASDQMLRESALPKGATSALRVFCDQILAWQDLKKKHTLPELIRHILENSGYLAMWKSSTTPDAPGRLENLKELSNVTGDFESLDAFLEHVSLVTDLAPKAQEPSVTLMTFHMAKGLEFKTVFLSGWEEGLFPHQRVIDENGAQGVEEERRLAYVGLTRAKEKAIITFAWSRRFYQGWQQCLPSRFIDELPSEHVDNSTSARLFTTRPCPHEEGPSSCSPSASATPVVSDSNQFYPGNTVYHDKFGSGKIIAIENDKADVHFKTGIKKIITRFLKHAQDAH